jgi:hypothetical protein
MNKNFYEQSNSSYDNELELNSDSELYGGLKCPKGMIVRKGYTTKKSSKRVSRKVKPTCIKDLGRPGHGPKTLPLIGHDISLSEYGYSVKESAKKRQTALNKASEKYGTLPILRRINLIRNYSDVIPENYAAMSNDVEYMKNKYTQEKNMLWDDKMLEYSCEKNMAICRKTSKKQNRTQSKKTSKKQNRTQSKKTKKQKNLSKNKKMSKEW